MAIAQPTTPAGVDEALAAAAAGPRWAASPPPATSPTRIAFLTSDLAAGITGQLLPVDGGML